MHIEGKEFKPKSRKKLKIRGTKFESRENKKRHGKEQYLESKQKKILIPSQKH